MGITNQTGRMWMSDVVGSTVPVDDLLSLGAKTSGAHFPNMV